MIGTSAQNGWGMFLTLVGGLWLLYLERDRIRAALGNFLNGQIYERPALSAEQRDRLIAQLSTLQPRAFGIIRDGLPDCVHLGDQFHALFGSLNWPSAFLPDQKTFSPVFPGIRVRSRPDDHTAAEVRRILGEVLGLPIGMVIEGAQNMDWFEIEIGRKPL